jgi:ATP-dependent DNA ligase
MRWYRAAHMWAFDLIELDGADMRREPLAQRKALLERALARATPGLRFNEHLHDEDGPLGLVEEIAGDDET